MPKDKTKRSEGRLTLTGRGFGFVHPESGPDILVPFDHLATATSGDTVLVEHFPEANPEKPAGRVVRVVERSTLPFVGRVRHHGKELRLYPEGQRIGRALILKREALQAFTATLPEKKALQDGDVVSAEFVSWEDPRNHPVGRPLELVGRRDDPKSEVLMIALARGFALEFPEEVNRAADEIAAPQMQDREGGRRDLRQVKCFTIDPESARDFDDALSIHQRPDGRFTLSVHIADVSHYVSERGAIDKEAWQRGTSVYLGNTVLPMLPERLSNDLCSLVPNKPRYAVTVQAVVDSTGTVSDAEIFPSIIKSARRFTYREVEAVLHGAPDPLAAQLHLLHLVTQQLRRLREQDGSVDLDIGTPNIILDENGVPVSIRPSERLFSQRLVEESMLLANRLVAERLLESKTPGIYRVHDQPRESDVEVLISTLEQLGIKYNVEEQFGPEDYRNILAIIENLDFKDFVEALAMRSLNKAVYDTENRGHFGLAMDAYTHFTSPIRRYPDIVVHRMIKRQIERRRVRPSPKLLEFLSQTCDRAVERERAATNAERAFTRLKALQYLEKRIGRDYAGTVSGVTSFGLFVEIDRYLVEGLVPIATLGKERFELERANHRIVGQKSGTTYRLGDRVHISVKSVDTQERRAEFRLLRS